MEENVISKVMKDGKTYFEINDYKKLQSIFGELLREVQRIKSAGDYEACQALVEGYGVKVDKNLHKEVLERVKKLNIAPYGGFINPKMVIHFFNLQLNELRRELSCQWLREPRFCVLSHVLGFLDAPIHRLFKGSLLGELFLSLIHI